MPLFLRVPLQYILKEGQNFFRDIEKERYYERSKKRERERKKIKLGRMETEIKA